MSHLGGPRSCVVCVLSDAIHRFSRAQHWFPERAMEVLGFRSRSLDAHLSLFGWFVGSRTVTSMVRSVVVMSIVSADRTALRCYTGHSGVSIVVAIVRKLDAEAS